MYKLHFDNFLINEHDDDDDGLLTGLVRVQGSGKGNQHSVIKGLPAASLLQTPGARSDTTTWCDEFGQVWLFGGEGYDDNTSSAKLLNDLWLFNTSRLEWNIMHTGRIQSTLLTKNGENSMPFKGETGYNGTSGAPKPRKRAASCGVPGILFVIFGGIDSEGKSLSDTWIYIMPKAEWLPLSWNVTKSAYPPTTWSTEASWCHLDSLYVIGSRTGNVTEMWKLCLRTLKWSNESHYLLEQQAGPLPAIQAVGTNSVSVVWNRTFYLYNWQIIHGKSFSNSLVLSIDLQCWRSLPPTNVINNWHSTPFLWTHLNSSNTATVTCSSLAIFQQSSDHVAVSGQSCNLHRCYTVTNSTSWPDRRWDTRSWFYEGKMYIFGGHTVVDDMNIFFSDLFILQQFDSATNLSAVLVLSLIIALVVFVFFGTGVFCILRYWDYRHGRQKSHELRIRYTPLRDLTPYE